MSTSCDASAQAVPLQRLRAGRLLLDSSNSDSEAKFHSVARYSWGSVESLHEANTSVGCAGSNTVSIIRIIERRSRETWGAVERQAGGAFPGRNILIFRGVLFMKKVVLASLLSATALIPFAVQTVLWAGRSEQHPDVAGGVRKVQRRCDRDDSCCEGAGV